jgi:hypothetical protein
MNLDDSKDPFDQSVYSESNDDSGDVVPGLPAGLPAGADSGSQLAEAMKQQSQQHQQTQELPEPEVHNIDSSANMTPAHIEAGHRCAEYEEDHAGLCYTKCSILAGEDFPHRGTPWTCCKDNPCKMNRFKKSFGMIVCSGYAVAGTAGKSCPHKHGACLSNEEMFMNVCYKTCKELTEGTHPHRVAAATCCKSQSAMSCLNPMILKTRAAYDVGGGAGDGDSNTPKGPHAPHTLDD